MITNLKGKKPNDLETMKKYLNNVSSNKLGTLLISDIKRHLNTLKPNNIFNTNEYILKCKLFKQLENIYEKKKCSRRTMSAGTFMGNFIKSVIDKEEMYYIMSKSDKCNVYKLCK